MEDKKFRPASFNCENQFIETYTQTIDNTGFLTMRFLHIE
jgi:hypothetical protein